MPATIGEYLQDYIKTQGGGRHGYQNKIYATMLFEALHHKNLTHLPYTKEHDDLLYSMIEQTREEFGYEHNFALDDLTSIESSIPAVREFIEQASASVRQPLTDTQQVLVEKANLIAYKFEANITVIPRVKNYKANDPTHNANQPLESVQFEFSSPQARDFFATKIREEAESKIDFQGMAKSGKPIVQLSAASLKDLNTLKVPYENSLSKKPVEPSSEAMKQNKEQCLTLLGQLETLQKKFPEKGLTGYCRRLRQKIDIIDNKDLKEMAGEIQRAIIDKEFRYSVLIKLDYVKLSYQQENPNKELPKDIQQAYRDLAEINVQKTYIDINNKLESGLAGIKFPTDDKLKESCQALIDKINSCKIDDKDIKLLNFCTEQRTLLKNTNDPKELFKLHAQLSKTYESVNSQHIKVVEKITKQLESRLIGAQSAKAKAEDVKVLLRNIPIEERKNFLNSPHGETIKHKLAEHRTQSKQGQEINRETNTINEKKAARSFKDFKKAFDDLKTKESAKQEVPVFSSTSTAPR